MFEIRKATLKEIDIILKMALKLDISSTREKIKKATEEGHLFVAVSDNTFLGYILIEFLDQNHHLFPNSIFINDLFVEEDFRNKGVGKSLVNFVLNQKYPPKYRYFSITHSPKKPWLSHYYESFGFKENGVTEAGNVKMILR